VPAGAEATLDASSTAIVGMHPCDITSTWLLDKVFAAKNEDPYYLGRRGRAMIVGVDCARPCDQYQFCLDMESLYPKRGFDLFLQDLGDRYYVIVGSERGGQWIEKTKLFTAASHSDLLAHEQFEQAKAGQFTRKLPFPASKLVDLLGESYDSLIWDAVARRCYSCGACNLVCPTCYCFNVYDETEMNLADGERRRRWDGCQLRDFAEVAGGENFREQAAQRLRHRIFRKGKYMKEQFGEFGCVGCGRCDRHCTSSISIRKTFQQLWEYQMQKQAEREQALAKTPANICRGPGESSKSRISPSASGGSACSSRTAAGSTSSPASSPRFRCSASARPRSRSARPAETTAHSRCAPARSAT
jgi:ferredoxin